MEIPVTKIPEVKLKTSSVNRKMPVMGLGTAADPFDATAMRAAILDTASMYGSEEVLGEAIAEAIRLGLISSREELFITSKLWCCDAHSHLVVPALKKSLK